MSKLSFRARALDASKPMPIYLAEELPDLPDYSAINRAVPQMPSGMEKEEESEHHLQRAISGTGLIIPTPEVCEVTDLSFYERCYPPDYKMPKQHIHMQPLWEEEETPEYDMDSEDERWLKQQRHPELTELVFEQMMDKLEKCSGQTVVTLSEAKLLLERHDDLVIAVYDYWLNKRLNTQHALIVSVRTESRAGQPANNPYLAFRRRTEKMQTRKNRKNDESSYEKMLKLRRDLARALSLLQLVARRERAKRDLVRLTHAVASARYRAGDYQPDPHPALQHRTVYAVGGVVSVGAGGAGAGVGAGAGAVGAGGRREALALQYVRAQPDRERADRIDRQPRQREKRPYKRKKHRHHALGALPAAHRPEEGVSSSEEEAGAGGAGAEPASPPDPGPFAFRRKPGCYYELPTSTLYGEPLPGERHVYQHEADERHRFTLASLSDGTCVGFARRRVGRGGRVLLDRLHTPLHALWRTLPPHLLRARDRRHRAHQEMELETLGHRTPKELVRDYHSSGRYPWRHAFRRHLARRPDLWLGAKPDDPLPEPWPKPDPDLKSDISLRTVYSASETENAIRANLAEEMRVRKRRWEGGDGGCSGSDSDGDSDPDAPLWPVEREFDALLQEVSRKWLHFRPKTPPPSPPPECEDPLDRAAPFAVELRPLAPPPPPGGYTPAPPAPTAPPDEPFVTTDLTLDSLFPELDAGATIPGVEATRGDDAMDVDTEDFLSQGQGLSGRARPGCEAGAGCSRVTVSHPPPPRVPRPRPPTPPPPAPPAPPAHTPSAPPTSHGAHKQVEQTPSPTKKVHIPPVKEEKEKERPREREKEKTDRSEWAPPSPVPTAHIIVEEVNEVPHAIKLDKKKPVDTIEEVVLSHGVQLKTVQTKHSPLKKHIITSGARRAPAPPAAPAHTPPAPPAPADAHAQPQMLTVAVSDHLKVRIQNHMSVSGERAVGGVGGVGGVVGLVQNGPYHPATAPAPAPSPTPAPTHAPHTAHTHTVASVGGGVGVGQRRVGGVVTSRGSIVQLGGAVSVAATHAPVVLAPSHTIHHVAPNKLKVLHAHPLTHTQRNQLLAQNRSITQLPAVVSLATLGEAKASNAALLKAAPGALTQFIEIKGTQFGKGPHLVNVVRGAVGGVGGAGGGVGAAGGAGAKAARLELNDAKKRQVVATLDTAHLKGNIQAVSRPHRVNVCVEGRGVVRPPPPAHPAHPPHPAHPAHPAHPVAVRAHHLRHQIQLKGRALVPASGVGVVGGAGGGGGVKPTTIPGSVVANLLHKNVTLPKGGQKIAISHSGHVAGVSGVSVSGVQAIAFTAAQLKARGARLIAPARHHAHTAHSELVETVSVAGSSVGAAGGGGGAGGGVGAGGAGAGADLPEGDAVRRSQDTLPMEVT